MGKTALITGITGQDGAYLAQLLLRKDYHVCGLVRRNSSVASNRYSNRLQHLGIDNHPGLRLVEGDVTDASSLVRAVREAQPDEVYNLAAQSFVGTSWKQPLFTSQATAMGAVNMLEAVRLERPYARYYQASSSEMFGTARGSKLQNEYTVFEPCSPYAVAKVFAHHMTINYRRSFGMHASCGILFNHESPLRGLEFVTRKITHGVAQIKAGLADRLVLGNLEARRDWGHAVDYVYAMWLMLQQDVPDDYVIATGETASVGDFVRMAFAYAGLPQRDYVHSGPEFLRPSEVPHLCGDATKACTELGWSPTFDLEMLVADMMDADLHTEESRLVC
jgi:GDPmannose 4,6-dehydratase